MRALVIVLSLVAVSAAEGKERATFLLGQYATAEQCDRLRKIEAGEEPPNVSTAPVVLDADGFHGWEGGCAFTKIFDHEPGTMWLALMICSEGMAMNAASYVFVKNGSEDAFDVYGSGADEDAPEVFRRCDARKGNE